MSGGALGSPPILLRSGIGPADELRSLDIPVIADLPVGRRMMEHPGAAIMVTVSPEVGRLGWPHLAVVSRGATYWAIPMPHDQKAGVAVLSFFLAATDWDPGVLKLRSSDPTVLPEIRMPFDRVVADGLFGNVEHDFHALLGTAAFREAGITDGIGGDEPFSRRAAVNMRSGAHPAGGCQIGSVVDSRFAVLGTQGLSVVDASVFPRHATNNPNLTCFMLGERAAHFAGAPAPRLPDGVAVMAGSVLPDPAEAI